MLLLMMELKGRFNSKMIKKAKFGDIYFDNVGGFMSLERDKVTGAVRYFILFFTLSILIEIYLSSDQGRHSYSTHLQTNSRPPFPSRPTTLRQDERRRAQNDHIIYRPA